MTDDIEEITRLADIGQRLVAPNRIAGDIHEILRNDRRMEDVSAKDFVTALAILAGKMIRDCAPKEGRRDGAEMCSMLIFALIDGSIVEECG